jgi:hypothetical protein
MWVVEFAEYTERGQQRPWYFLRNSIEKFEKFFCHPILIKVSCALKNSKINKSNCGVDKIIQGTSVFVNSSDDAITT